MSKSETLNTSDANTGKKKKRKISSSAGARNNHAALPTSDGIRERPAATIAGVGSDRSSPDEAPSGGTVALISSTTPAREGTCASRASHSHPDRAKRASDPQSSLCESPDHHARRSSSRSLPTRAPAG